MGPDLNPAEHLWKAAGAEVTWLLWLAQRVVQPNVKFRWSWGYHHFVQVSFISLFFKTILLIHNSKATSDFGELIFTFFKMYCYFCQFQVISVTVVGFSFFNGGAPLPTIVSTSVQYVLKQSHSELITGTIYEPNVLSCGYLQVSKTGRLTGVEFPLLPSLLAVTEDEKVLIAGTTNEQTHLFQAAFQEVQSFGDLIHF